MSDYAEMVESFRAAIEGAAKDKADLAEAKADAKRNWEFYLQANADRKLISEVLDRAGVPVQKLADGKTDEPLVYRVSRVVEQRDDAKAEVKQHKDTLYRMKELLEYFKW